MNLINTIESMKKVFLFVAAVLLCLACNEAGRTVSVTVSNATSLERSGEMVEVPWVRFPLNCIYPIRHR